MKSNYVGDVEDNFDSGVIKNGILSTKRKHPPPLSRVPIYPPPPSPLPPKLAHSGRICRFLVYIV